MSDRRPRAQAFCPRWIILDPAFQPLAMTLAVSVAVILALLCALSAASQHLPGVQELGLRGPISD